ncbi:MAG: hypothetical protein AAAFM81_01275 [Pseudomonadota bacterium]
MDKVVFLSQDSMDGYVCDDDVALDAFAAEGIHVTTRSWRSDTDWSTYDAVIVRSTWDYQRHADAFFEALARIDAATRMANPLAIMHWNMDKRYLDALSQQDIPIVPTTFGQGLTRAALDIMIDESDAECVIKPVISAGAERTFRVPSDASDALRNEIATAHANSGWMWQPFLSQIVTEGEYSVFYFNGTLSHAIVKKPKAGDFRVQEEFGGLLTEIQPDTAMLSAAERVLDALEVTPLYARVDLVPGQGQWMLIELELIEPSLYLRKSASAPANFARAVRQWLDNG